MTGFVVFLFCLWILFGPKPKPKRELPDPETTRLVTPLLRRLSRDWQRVDDVVRDAGRLGIRNPYLKLFWAAQFRWIETRKLPWRYGEWVRLTPLGERNTSANSNRKASSTWLNSTILSRPGRSLSAVLAQARTGRRR